MMPGSDGDGQVIPRWRPTLSQCSTLRKKHAADRAGESDGRDRLRQLELQFVDTPPTPVSRTPVDLQNQVAVGALVQWRTSCSGVPGKWDDRSPRLNTIEETALPGQPMLDEEQMSVEKSEKFRDAFDEGNGSQPVGAVMCARESADGPVA
jgi:hypothetical protein